MALEPSANQDSAAGGQPAPATGGKPAGPNLLRRALLPAGNGAIHAITPEGAGWTYTGLHAWRLIEGEAIETPADGRERLVLVLEGHARVTAGEEAFGEIGSRASVFDGPPPPVVLVAPETAVRVEATSTALVVIGDAPAGPVRRTALIGPGEILVENRGSGQTARKIHHLLPPAAEAGRLIAFEVFTPGGNWSSYPPHKHDTENPPVESYLEEIYFYRFAKPQGFAFARVYTPDRSLDESLAPGDGDIVLVPRGYHPVGAPSGYDCYYLNVMAGHGRAWHFTMDPDHAWLMNWDPAAPTVAQEETAR